MAFAGRDPIQFFNRFSFTFRYTYFLVYEVYAVYALL